MAYETITTKTGTPSSGLRVVFALVGAVAMIIGAFLTWTDSVAGTSIGIKALWSASPRTSSNLFFSMGVLMIVLGLVGVLSLASATGWTTRLCGSLGIIAVILFGIQVYRSDVLGSLGFGAWVSGLGSVLLLVAGMFGGSRTTTRSVPPPYVPPR